MAAFAWIGADERELCATLLDRVYAVVLPTCFPVADKREFERLEDGVTLLEERVRQWTQEWLQEGRAEGLEMGLEHERGLLCRQASRRFGAGAGERLAAVLAEVSDPARLEEAGDLIVDCASGEELIGRLKGAGRRLFRSRRFVADLLRGFVPAELLGELDLSTLRGMPAEYLGRGGRRRVGDLLWVADRPNGARVLLPIEIQSADDSRMAARVMAETGLLYESLTRAAWGAGGDPPAVLPLVVHVGAGPWTAADDLAAGMRPGDPLAEFLAGRRFFALDLAAPGRDDPPERNRMAVFVRVHRSPSAAALARELAAAFAWIGGDERELREALLDWVYAVVLPTRFPEADRREFERLEDEVTLLEERVQRWTREWLEEGRAEGLEVGRSEGLDRGLERGRAEGLAHERGLLCRQASRRFGAGAGERLAAVLAEVADPARLEEAGDLIVDCASGEELIGRLNGAG